MKPNNYTKKGFTLTELAIVIAVIAVLIAVLVPTFISLINKANNSSDEQTVKNMNTALQIDEADNDKPEYLCQVWTVLEKYGYNPAPAPDYTDNEFYWYKSVNRVVIVSASQSEITFPSEYAGITVTDGTAVNTSMRLTAAKATADSIDKSALVSLEVGEYDAQAHNYDANGECQLCNRSIADDPDHVHSLDEGVVTKEATCTQDGEITYTCTACHQTVTETIAASHTWNEGEVTAVTESDQTCTITYTCTIDGCGTTKTETENLTGTEARPYAITGSSDLAGGDSEETTKYYKLYSNITNAQAITVSGYVSIDLNGCTLTCTEKIITNTGMLTINDSSEEGTGKIYNSNSTSASTGTAIKNTGTLIVESGTITAGYYGIYSTAGTVTILGGTIGATNDLSCTTAVNVSNTALTISGGTITTGTASSAQAISIGNGCTVEISDGTISGFTAIQVEDNFTATLSISGGTITSTSTSQAGENYRMAVVVYSGTVSISGGTFNGSVYIESDVTNYSSAIIGGNFSTNYAYTSAYLSSYLASGYTLSALSAQVSGYYTIVES